MVRAVFGHDLVAGTLGREGLKDLLQLALGVVLAGLAGQLTQVVGRHPKDKPPHGFEVAVEVERPDERFEGVREVG